MGLEGLGDCRQAHVAAGQHQEYANWAERFFGLGMAGALGRGKVDYKNCQPFRAGNQYRSQMTPAVVTQTARMGSPSTGTSHVVPVSPGNPIIGVSIWAGDVVQGLSFTFKDGSTSPHLGDTAGTRNDFSFCEVDQQGNKTWHVLSSIYVNGMSNFYRCVDSAVFGFQYERPASS